MGRRKKERRNLSFSDEVNAYLDTKVKTRDASATVELAIRTSRNFKFYIKDKKNENRNRTD